MLVWLVKAPLFMLRGFYLNNNNETKKRLFNCFNFPFDCGVLDCGVIYYVNL